MTSSSITNDSETYNEHIKFIKETYKFQDLTDEIYDQASKYGEAFVYVVPYKKAVARLLKQKNNTRAELDIKEHTIITESGNIEMDKLPKEITPEMFEQAGLNNIQLECYTGAINSVVENIMRFEKASRSLNEMSLNYEGADFSEETIEESANNIRDVVKGRFQKTIKDDLSFEDEYGECFYFSHLSYIDVLIDGKYESETRRNDLQSGYKPAWRGSSNQRLIDVQNSIKQGKIVLVEEETLCCI